MSVKKNPYESIVASLETKFIGRKVVYFDEDVVAVRADECCAGTDLAGTDLGHDLEPGSPPLGIACEKVCQKQHEIAILFDAPPPNMDLPLRLAQRERASIFRKDRSSHPG